MSRTLYYVHDPMCSWCWAFSPGWARIRERLPPDIAVRRVLGGLAPDSDVPMPMPMREYLQQTWRRIQQVVPGTRFNFDFWRECEPRRSTYPACRAVLAAAAVAPALEEPMIAAIQHAYYLEARNPSDEATLIDLAVGLGLEREPFSRTLQAPETHAALLREVEFARRLGAHGFPALILRSGEQLRALAIDYQRPDLILAQLDEVPAA